MSTQAGLSLLWIYLSFCRFCCAPAHLQFGARRFKVDRTFGLIRNPLAK